MSRFRRISTDRLFEVPWARLLRHQLGDASGTPLERSVLTLETPDWVNVVAVTREGDYVLVRQHRFGTQEDSLEIPGGLIDAGEDPAAAAARELREETGYAAGSVRSAGWCYANPAIQSTKLYTFVAEDCTLAGDQELDELEDCRVEVVSRETVRRMIAAREISHALVLVALLDHLGPL